MKRIRIFCTCILPERMIAKYGLSFAACNFSGNLISGNGFQHVYSIMPLYVRGELESEAFTDPRFEVVYDQCRGWGKIASKLAILKEQWMIFKKIPKNASVWFYNLNTLNSFLFLLLKLFKSTVLLNVIVLDYTPVTKYWGLNKIYLKLINMADARICLADSELFNSEHAVVLPGVVPYAPEQSYPVITEPKRIFLLSGVLAEEISQLSLVLEAFSQSPSCELHITGQLGNEELIRSYRSRCKNIYWHGQLPFPDYLNLLHSVTFQLSTRHPGALENECNFPSKIIEALLHNRIVVSTIHYPQLDNIKYFEVNSATVELLKDDLKRIIAMSDEDLLGYANQSNIVQRQFNVVVWNEAMSQLEEK